MVLTGLMVCAAVSMVAAAMAWMPSISRTGQGERTGANAEEATQEWYPVFINHPGGTPRIDTSILDQLGRQVSVSCGSCHSNTTPNLALNRAEDLTEFHTGLHYHHGSLSCMSCHNADNYNLLRLADGRALAYERVMTLCSQCHAPQARDYARGAHGGMTGYWDRSRGPQVRKSCTDCHDPHAPGIPAMLPTFKPHDRFLEPPH